MAAATAQQKRPQTTPGSTGKQTKGSAPKKSIPYSAGILIMAVLLVLSLFVGNMRALQNATPASFLRQGDVSGIIKARAEQAMNVESVASQGNPDAALTAAVDAALKDFNSAKTARELSRADQKLITAVSELNASVSSSLDSTRQGNLSKAVANFDEQGNFLRQEARKFNTAAEKAVQLYNTLPTRFLLSQPDYYEGL